MPKKSRAADAARSITSQDEAPAIADLSQAHAEIYRILNVLQVSILALQAEPDQVPGAIEAIRETLEEQVYTALERVHWFMTEAASNRAQAAGEGQVSPLKAV